MRLAKRLSHYQAGLTVSQRTTILSGAPRRSKVGIIAANESFAIAPFSDPEWEIWGCNSLWRYCRDEHGLFRADRWFEMHPMSVQTVQEEADIWACPVPIYLLDVGTETFPPHGIEYPLEAVLARFPYHYFTCTFAYQIALALHEGFTTIGLFGVELNKGTSRERIVEKACVEFWMGLALGQGVKVIIPDDSALANQSALYGYEYAQEVDEVNGIVDGIFFQRLQELERTGAVQKIPMNGPPMKEGHA